MGKFREYLMPSIKKLAATVKNITEISLFRTEGWSIFRLNILTVLYFSRVRKPWMTKLAKKTKYDKETVGK